MLYTVSFTSILYTMNYILSYTVSIASILYTVSYIMLYYTFILSSIIYEILF